MCILVLILSHLVHECTVCMMEVNRGAVIFVINNPWPNSEKCSGPVLSSRNRESRHSKCSGLAGWLRGHTSSCKILESGLASVAQMSKPPSHPVFAVLPDSGVKFFVCETWRPFQSVLSEIKCQNSFDETWIKSWLQVRETVADCKWSWMFLFVSLGLSISATTSGEEAIRGCWWTTELLWPIVHDWIELDGFWYNKGWKWTDQMEEEGHFYLIKNIEHKMF